MSKNQMRPVHPGEVLREEYLNPLNMTPHALAKALHLTPSRMNEIVREERGISPDTALRLSVYFNTTAQFWLNMQMSYDLRVVEKNSLSKIIKEVHPRSKFASA